MNKSGLTFAIIMRSEPFISLRGRGFRAFRVAATERPGGANAGRGFRAFRVAATERPDGANASRAWRQSGQRLDSGGDPS